MGIKQFICTKRFENFAKHIPLSPNMLTFMSVIAALIAAYFIFLSEVTYGLLFAFFAFVLDGIDGIVARAKREETLFGAYFDGISDRIVEFFVLASMMNLKWPNMLFASYSILIIIAFGTFLTSFAKAYADHKRVMSKQKIEKMHCFFERSERVTLIFISLILYIFVPLYAMYLLCIGALFSVLAFLQRFIEVTRQRKISKR